MGGDHAVLVEVAQFDEGRQIIVAEAIA